MVAGTRRDDGLDDDARLSEWTVRMRATGRLTELALTPLEPADTGQLAAAIAGQTKRIAIRAGSVVLPLHDPLRVAEQAVVLDLLSKGRLRLGLGRGLARREFAAFRGTMNE